MDIRWKIPFMTRRNGELMTVNIYDEDYYDDPVVLIGGAEPFTTREDDSEDHFTPVRTQSGYIRIIDNGFDADGNVFDWKDLIPETDISRPVTLTSVRNGQNVVHWQGYLQAQDFGSTIFGGPQEREFPVQCVLSSLSASGCDNSARTPKNFAYIIWYAFDGLPEMEFDNFVFQGGGEALNWLMKLVDWQNMIYVNSRDLIDSRYNNLIALKDVCSYWGWTCRVHRRTVVFSRTDDGNTTGALVLTWNQLETLSRGTAIAGTVETFARNYTINGDVFASMENTEYLMRGYSYSLVTNDANQADDVVFGAFPDSVTAEMKSRETYSEQDGDMTLVCSEDQRSFFALFENGICRAGYASFNVCKAESLDSETDFDAIRIKEAFVSANASAFATFSTEFAHCFYDAESSSSFRSLCGFILKGSVYQKAHKLSDFDSTGKGKSQMYMRLGIGFDRNSAVWWNGNTWQSGLCAFRVSIGNEEDVFYSMYSSEAHLLTTYRKYIPTNAAGLTGKIFIDFLGSDNIIKRQTPFSDMGGPFEIADFRIEYVKSTKSGALSSSRKYECLSSRYGKMYEEWSRDLVYATDDRMSFGYGVVLNPNGTQMSSVSMGGSEVIPEQNLANRVQSYWTFSRRRLRLDLRMDVVGIDDVDPRTVVRFYGNGGDQYVTASMSNNWRDDVMTLVLDEK